MNTEKLQKANELAGEIKKLNDHYSFVKTANNGAALYESSSTIVRIKPQNSNTERTLRYDMLPISTKNYMAIYISNVENEIKRLEKEFENL